jgi:hypothetical protein
LESQSPYDILFQFCDIEQLLSYLRVDNVNAHIPNTESTCHMQYILPISTNFGGTVPKYDTKDYYRSTKMSRDRGVILLSILTELPVMFISYCRFMEAVGIIYYQTLDARFTICQVIWF